MSNKLTYKRYQDLKKAEIFLEEYIAKYLKNANPKSKEDIKFWMKKAEEDLYGRKNLKSLPKNVAAIIRQTRGTSGQTAGASFFNSLAFAPSALINNLDKWSKRGANKRALKLGLKPKYANIGPNQPLRIPYGTPSPFEGDKNIITLLEAIRAERWTTEDVMGTRMASDIDANALIELNLPQQTTDTNATNLYYDKRFDRITNKTRIDQERNLFKKLQKGNASYDNVFYLSGSNWRGQIDKNSPNYYISKNENNNQALSIANRNQYGGTAAFDMNQGNVPWTDRSIRGPKQANDETRSLLISQGLNERQVNLLDNDTLSRFRISGPLTDSNRGMTISKGGGGILRLRRNRNSLSTSSGTVYEGTAASKE